MVVCISPGLSMLQPANHDFFIRGLNDAYAGIDGYIPNRPFTLVQDKI